MINQKRLARNCKPKLFNIANMSIAQGAKADNINDKGNVGNKKVVYFEVSVKDQVKIHENYKIVQDRVNAVEKSVDEINKANPVSQFIMGAVDGVKDNLVGTATMIAHPLETLTAIKDVAVALSSLTAEDVGKITEAVKGKISDTFTTRDGINSIPYGAGYAVGMIVTDIVIGKGVGIALEAVKEIPAIKNLLTKLGDLKSLATAKVAEKFSDEAASLASQRARKALATQLYSGIPVDAMLDMAVVAGNKIGKGVVKFTEFSKQMVAEFGDKIKPKLLELYQDAFEKVHGARKTLDLDELLGGHSIEKHVGKSESWLRNRLLNESKIDYASTFRNYEVANRTIGKFVKENRQVIEDWLKSGTLRKDVNFTTDEIVGNVLGRGKGNTPLIKSIETNKVRISLVRDNTPQGWHVNTSFPVPSNGGFKW